MPVFGVKEWKNHLRVLRLGAISKIQRDYQNAILGYETEVLFAKIYRSCI